MSDSKVCISHGSFKRKMKLHIYLSECVYRWYVGLVIDHSSSQITPVVASYNLQVRHSCASSETEHKSDWFRPGRPHD